MARGMSRTTACEVSFCLRHTRNLRISEKEGVRLIWQTEPFRDIRRYVSECFDPNSDATLMSRLRPGLLWRVPLLALTWMFRRRDLPACQVDDRLKAIDCDVFCCFGLNVESSQVVATAASLGKPVILFLQANTDIPGCDEPSNGDGSTALARYVFRNSTRLVAQTRFQVDRLAKQYDRTAVHMPNPLDLSRWEAPDGLSRDYVLWVGRADDFHKRPLLCLEIARALPESRFLMLMNPSDRQIAERVHQTKPPNVTIREVVPHQEMPEVFARARAFLSTGQAAFEGFPNVLLQAAATQTPIVTMFDFDDFVSQSRSGLVVGDSVPAAVEALSRLEHSPPSDSDREATRAYLRKHHEIGRFCERLEAMLKELPEGPSRMSIED